MGSGAKGTSPVGESIVKLGKRYCVLKNSCSNCHRNRASFSVSCTISTVLSGVPHFMDGFINGYLPVCLY